MEISDDAKKLMETRVDRILRWIDVPASDKTEIGKELTSNYIDASMVKAQARGAGSVEKVDVVSALEASETPEEIASMYMASYVSSLSRAGLISRSIAYVIDTGITSMITVIVLLPFIPPTYQLTLETILKFSMLPMFFNFFYLLAIVNLTIIFIYFVIFEGFFGFTPGKWLLGLKIRRSDGKKAGYRETMLRSIPKLFLLAVIADALLIVYRRKDRQRLFDRIAGTIVIHRNKK
jgi:uncharacterized RDD family membrane protein YckC